MKNEALFKKIFLCNSFLLLFYFVLFVVVLKKNIKNRLKINKYNKAQEQS